MSSNRLEYLSPIRDGLIILIGIAYVLGYLYWSAKAFEHGLGLLPVLDAQYLATGTIPVVSLLIIGISIWSGFAKISTLDDQSRWQSLVAFVSIVIPLVLIITYQDIINYFNALYDSPTDLVSAYFDLLLSMKHTVDSMNLWEILLCALSLLIGIPFWIRLTLKVFRGLHTINWINFFMRGYLFLIYLGYTAVFLLAVSYLLLRPMFLLPFEFGGFALRCAYVDFESQNVSWQTRDVLLGVTLARDFEKSNQTLSGQKVIRSRRLEVLFAGSNNILIQSSDGPLELKRAVVNSIHWCEGEPEHVI